MDVSTYRVANSSCCNPQSYFLDQPIAEGAKASSPPVCSEILPRKGQAYETMTSHKFQFWDRVRIYPDSCTDRTQLQLQDRLDPLYYVNTTSRDFSKWWWRKKIGCKIHLKDFCLSPSILWMSLKGKEIIKHSDQYHFPHSVCCKWGRFLTVL